MDEACTSFDRLSALFIHSIGTCSRLSHHVTWTMHYCWKMSLPYTTLVLSSCVRTVPPVIIKSPANATVDEHSKVTLECHATGNPPPVITWTHNGVTIGDEEGIVNLQESNDSTSVSARIDSGLHVVARVCVHAHSCYPMQATEECHHTSFFCKYHKDLIKGI